MKKYTLWLLLKVLIVVILLVFVDFMAGYVLDRLYSTSKSGVSYQEYTIINKTNQEVLVFGSSRAAYHYVPSVLAEELKMSVYNSGREGTGIFFHNAVLISTLKRYTPKLIILDLDYRDIYMEGKGGFGPEVLKELTPFHGKISEKFDSLLVQNWYDPILFQSNLFKYNKKFFSVLTGNVIKSRDNYNGYRPLYGEWSKEIKKLDEVNLIPDSAKINQLEKFIEMAKNKNIQVVLTVSPYYIDMPVDLLKPLEEISKILQVTFLNHIRDKRFLSERNLFNDELHLNDKGAGIYSSIIADEIKLVLKSEGFTSTN